MERGLNTDMAHTNGAIDLATACSWWQDGRAGSSLLRAAARCLTGEPHYFKAAFIAEYERQARDDPRALEAASKLLDAVRASPVLTASGWCRCTGLREIDVVGRGLKEKRDEDPQIRAVLDTRTIVMPLWGVSLSRDVALRYGSRWLFTISGAFPGVAAWIESGAKPEEQEIITGGRYEVQEVEDQDCTTVVRLHWLDHVSCPRSSHP
jgi:hypothetical protein